MDFQSIFAWKSLPEAGFGKSVVIDAHRCSGSRIQLDHPNARPSVIQDHSSDHRLKRLHLTRASVRRASGFVLTGFWEATQIAERIVERPEVIRSLAPDGKPCGPYTIGLLLRRPIHAMLPFITIGKEVERKAQEGEDISILENTGPIRYQSGKTANTRAVDPGLQKRLIRFSLRQLTQSGLSRDTIIQARRGARLHPDTRARLAQAVEQLENPR